MRLSSSLRERPPVVVFSDADALYAAFVAGRLPRLTVGGLPGERLTRRQWAQLFGAICRRRPRGKTPPPFFSSINGQTISRYHDEAAVRALFRRCSGLAVDGMAAVFASRLLSRTPFPERVATTDLFHDVARHAEEAGLSFFLLGGTAETCAAAARNVAALYPRLNIVGTHHGFFAQDEEEALARHIDALAPDIVWVSMGVPREQLFCVRNRDLMRRVGLLKTSGGLFDFLSGRRSRAPVWMQACGLEWLYRLGLEPRRLLRRYAVTNFHAAILLMTRTGRQTGVRAAPLRHR